MPSHSGEVADHEMGWRSRLAIWSAGFLAFEVLSGLSIWLLPFSIFNQASVLIHTLIGLVYLVPCAYYLGRHWWQYRRTLMTHVKLLGYLGTAAIAAAAVSGGVLTVQSLWGTRITYFWDSVHLISTLAVVALVLPHIVLIVLSYRGVEKLKHLLRAAGSYALGIALISAVGLGLAWLAAFAYEPPRLQNQFADDYSYKYGKDRPFAPSLANTENGGALDARTLAGSESCGTPACHVQIVDEWKTSAHRYSAMDLGFQKIQLTMAQQNGPESTRYCGGCHDPISLFSGTKNLFTDAKQLTGLQGYQEGISCLSCHAVRETDLKGNAQYVVVPPPRYLFELEYNQSKSESSRLIRDFLIRSYPQQHIDGLSKKLFKAPEYCAACHKQFIDKEINNVGWVQLQNQFDNWRMSRWNHPDEPNRTIECRECHMPLEDSTDPAAGDSADYNRTANDGKHRSHRFLAANQMMPKLLQLPGWEKHVELTNEWLQGKYAIPEIADKWTQGPAVSVELRMPEEVRAGEEVTIKTVITSNKVGHDFPTGPLDIIQSWIQLVVLDEAGHEVYTTGKVDDKGFIQPGSFILKAEPVDQYGNLIDRHNLWEMVGVRHRRALFPGFADVTGFSFYCPEFYTSKAPPNPDLGSKATVVTVPKAATGTLRVEARLKYRKIDQTLLNFVFGENSGLTSPVTDMAIASGTIQVVPRKG